MLLIGRDTDSLVQEGLNFLVNHKKGQLTLVHSIIFLSFLLDSQSMIISLTPERIHSVKIKATQILSNGSILRKELAKVTGVFSSVLPAFLYKEVCQDLLWWIHCLLCVKGQPIQHQLPSVTIFSDASLLGWGATLGGVGIGEAWRI